MSKSLLKWLGVTVVIMMVLTVCSCGFFNHEDNRDDNHRVMMTVKGYRIVSAKSDEGVFQIVMKNHDDIRFEADYLDNDLEDLVCQKGIHQFTKVDRHYDCSTSGKIMVAKIRELALQSIEIIEEDGY